MDDIKRSYKGLIDSWKENNQSDAFACLFDLIESSLSKSIPLSKYQFANKNDQEHFEKQVDMMIDQINEMYRFAYGKMVEA